MKILDLFIPIPFDDYALLRGSGLSDEEIKKICLGAVKRAVSEKVNDINKEAFSYQMNKINDRIFNITTDDESEGVAV